MLPRLLILVSVLCLLLCVATPLLRVRSYWVADALDRVIICQGNLVWVNTDTSFPQPLRWPHHAEGPIDVTRQFMSGFSFSRSSSAEGPPLDFPSDYFARPSGWRSDWNDGA